MMHPTNNIFTKRFMGKTMKNFFILTFFIGLSICSAQQNTASTKKLAITVDDLPLATSVNHSPTKYKEIFLKGLDQLKKTNAPIIGFVNETFCYSNGREEKRRISLLEEWLNAGLDLGNHTFSHADANKLPVDKFTEDIKKGEIICSALLKAKGKQIKYFRFPYLRTGITLEDKTKIEKFLEKNGYTIAPATITSPAEMTYAEAYRNLMKNKDTVSMKKAADEFVKLLSDRITLGEKQSINLFKREISQILILHNSEMCSDSWIKIIDMIRGKGYTIVTLEEAMKDEVYQTKDNYVDYGGLDWLSRWAKARGVSNSIFSGRQPEPSEWINKLAENRVGY